MSLFVSRNAPGETHLPVLYGYDDPGMSFREFYPPPEGGWELADEKPMWWVDYNPPPKGAKIAISFRGQYHRYSPQGTSHIDGSVCSDYWVSADNIKWAIVDPLLASGAEVKFNFHTYEDVACQEFDRRLVKTLKPSKYKIDPEEVFEGMDWKNFTYSPSESLKLVMDDGWANFAILLRFDVQYSAPITQWNIDWEMLNYPYMERNGSRGGDLIFLFPQRLFDSFLNFLLEATRMESASNAIICPSSTLLRQGHGHGHALSLLDLGNAHAANGGGSCVHAIDPAGRDSSDGKWEGAGMFLGIVRNCTEKYLECVTKYHGTTGKDKHGKPVIR